MKVCEEIESESSLKLYRKTKTSGGVEKYVRILLGQEEVNDVQVMVSRCVTG